MRRRPTNQANQGLVIWREKAKTYIKSSPIGAKLYGPLVEAQRRPPTKVGLIWTQLGCGRPLPEPLGPIFGMTVHSK